MRVLTALLTLAALAGAAGGAELKPGEMIRNGDFSHGMAGWWSWTRPGDSARAEVVEGRLQLSVERASDWWTVNAYQRFGTLRSGRRYRLGFKARKRGPGSVMRFGFNVGAEPAVPIRIQGSVAPIHTVTLTDEERSYAFEFELAGDEPIEHGNLAFQVGALEEVWLDDVSLIGPTKAPTHWAARTTAVAAGGHAVLVELGERETLLHDGQFGMRHFPDGAIGVVRREPTLRLLLAAGPRSFLVEGSDMRHLSSAQQVLGPGEPGSFDNGYAGICAAYRHAGRGGLLAFYHAEDHEEMPEGVPGRAPPYYSTIALATATDGGRTFQKAGPVISSALPKDPEGLRDQGVGECCVVPDHDGRYLYCYYTEHSRTGGRGVQTCLARSPVEAAGRPGSWTKFHDGAFSEPGLGGRETPVVSEPGNVANAVMPHVTYCAAVDCYVMAYNVDAWRERIEGRPPERSGTYVAFSTDGVRWSEPARLIAAYVLPVPGEESAWHPTVIWDDADGASGEGWLCYGYIPNYGAHYLVGQRLSLNVEPNAR
jgi:hypothetical protein